MSSKPCTSYPSVTKTNKRKHVTLTIQEKLEIIDRLEKGENRNFIMLNFNIGSSTMYDIRKQKEELKKFAAKTVIAKNFQSRHTLKKPKLEILDSALYSWFCAKRSEEETVTGPMLIEKAKQLHRDLKIESPCMFSDGWFHNFKTRHGLWKLDVAKESTYFSADEYASEEYKDTFSNLVILWELTRCQVYNATITSLLWCCLPTSNLDEKSFDGLNKNEDRLTVLLCANASGDHRLVPSVIGKYEKLSTLEALVKLPVNYYVKSNVCVTSGFFKDWFFNHFVPEVQENFKKFGLPEDSRAVLMLGDCTVHPPADNLSSGNIFAVDLPSNVTPLIQPLMQGVVKNFKCLYRKSLVQSLLDAGSDVTDFQKHFLVQDAILKIAFAWDQVKELTLQRCWHKLWPSDEEVDQNESVTIDGHNLVLDLVETVPNNPFKDKVREEFINWIEIDKNVPVDEELNVLVMQSVVNLQEAHVSEQESEGNERKNEEKVSWKQASDALHTFIKFAESNESYNSEELKNLFVICNEFLKKRSKSCWQT